MNYEIAKKTMSENDIKKKWRHIEPSMIFEDVPKNIIDGFDFVSVANRSCAHTKELGFQLVSKDMETRQMNLEVAKSKLIKDAKKMAFGITPNAVFVHNEIEAKYNKSVIVRLLGVWTK